MASKNIDLSKAMNELLLEYGDAIRDAIAEVLPKVAKETVSQLKAKSPKRTGAYARSWTLQNWKNNQFYTGVTVFNKDHYQITHLLEFGHERRGGGRDVPAYEHIYPVEQWANEELISEVKQKVEHIK